MASLLDAVASVLALEISGRVAVFDVGVVAGLLAIPPRPDMGAFALPCFQLAKVLGLPAPKLAQELASTIEPSTPIAKLEAAGPFLNIHLDHAAAAAIVLPAWLRGEKPGFVPVPGKVMVEYSQPNTHKAFHVGHMRNLCLGDAIVRLLRATGHEIVAANYLGDVGTHVAKCLWGLEQLDVGSVPASGRGEWLGSVYSLASNTLEDWQVAAKQGSEDAAAKYQVARERMSVILRGIETRDPQQYERWQRTRAWSLAEFDEIYAWVGVHFDRVFYESEVDEPSLHIVDEFLAKGVFAQSEGAIGIHNPEIKHMPFFMLRKSDGTSLYATKDLALARKKFEEFDITRSIYVVDARQSDHFKQVFLTLRKMGFVQAEHCEHIGYEMVELPTGAMSSRKVGTLEHPAEIDLLLAIAHLPSVVAAAAASLRPSVVCTALYGLAKAYNRFQQECDVLHQSDSGVLDARLQLATATRAALAWALGLLGIDAPERM